LRDKKGQALAKVESTDAFAAQDAHQAEGDRDCRQQLNHAGQPVIMGDRQGAPQKKDKIYQSYHITIHVM
jgi:hypothetical protein